MDAFTSEEIVPDVIDVQPSKCLEVRYGGIDLQPNTNLTPTQVKDKPKITYSSEDGDFFTLIMSDPDAPSRMEPKMKEVLHWLVINIPGNDVSKGNHVAEYIGSGAPKGSGLHRYILLLFKQKKGKIQPDEFQEKIGTDSINGRRQFNTRGFAQKYDLELEAGNFFQAEWDEYVPLLHKQLGFSPPAPSSQ